jgi:hypothetical protein
MTDDLIARLRDPSTLVEKEEAATALEQKDARIAALTGLLQECSEELHRINNDGEWDDLCRRLRAALSGEQPARHLTVTRNQDGAIVLVSWQDDEGRILEVVAEQPAKAEPPADAGTGVFMTMPNPTPCDLVDPQFNAIWEVIKHWDINAMGYYQGYCGGNGSHVMLILQALRAQAQRPTSHVLTDAQCDEFRRLNCSFNDMVRAIYAAGLAAAGSQP